ncbi:hypothetical protein HPB49_013548 [Dermacentor silvarum]|uniref:Uncharacterized protein n=1 Tax=Dermacentor silvarum TaxID=543639 RepID=A0ACB8DDF8_DERSI|nr:hypothetical protein HPB49_013548 [Dermacentor silvarum]
MSGESSLAFLDSIRPRRGIIVKGLSKGTAATSFAVLSLLGVCGIAAALTLIVLDWHDDAGNETMTTAVSRVTLPVAPLRGSAAPSQPAPDHRHIHSKHVASLSSGKVPTGVPKHGRKANTAREASSNASAFPERKADALKEGRTMHNGASADSGDTLEHNSTAVTVRQAPAFASGEDYYREVSNSFNMSIEAGDNGVMEGSEENLHHSSLLGEVSSSSSSPPRESPVNQSIWPSTVRTTTAISTEVSSTSFTTTTTQKTTTMAATMTSSRTRFVVEDATLSPAADSASGDNPKKRKSGSSSWLLFCFYDDRSSVRSPGFKVYDFPVQLCTDVAFCCVDVNAKGKVVITKNLKLFLEVVAHEFLPPSHLFITLGGHRLLAHHLDAALQNTARFATELSEEAQRLGAGGLAIYLEDVEVLKHAFRVHDLIMAVRGVSVAVVLPRDLRQQVRYYHTEIYADTKDMLVISPPSQGYGGRQLRPAFATCPHPRRSVREGSSLEFIYQLSRTLLSSMVDGTVNYASSNGVAAVEQPTAPRYLIGVSFGGLKFQLKNRSLHDVGSPATFVRAVPFREICSQPWHHWHDNVSECFVAWDGDRGWMSSLGPRSVGFAAELADGLAVFDLDFDDHHGECGNKFPVLRALRAALIARHAKKLA